MPRIGTLPLVGLPLGVLPLHRGDRFPRSTQEPESGSRRLYAGHRLGSKQVSPRLCPRPGKWAWFRWHPSRFDTSSAVHLRSSSWFTPDRLCWPAFSENAHHSGLSTRAASGGLRPGPATRSRGTYPHLLCSKEFLDDRFNLLPCRRGTLSPRDFTVSSLNEAAV